MTERQYKKFAQDRMMEHKGIKVPMSHMQLLEYHPNINGINIDEVVFRNCDDNRVWCVDILDAYVIADAWD